MLSAALAVSTQSTADKLAPMGVLIAVLLVILVFGVIMYRGIWRTPVSKVYPGGVVLLVYIPIGFIVGIIGASVSIIWPPREYGWSMAVWLGLMAIGGLIGILGFIVGATAHPRALLPRWVRNELANNSNGSKNRTTK